MSKTILITGSSDGIGLETARQLVEQGNNVLLHGRSQKKLEKAASLLSTPSKSAETYVADLSRPAEVEQLAKAVSSAHSHLDVLINNAGVFVTPENRTADGLDVRFAVNTIAPYLLTNHLLPLMNKSSRVINLSSAAQSTVDIEALSGKKELSEDFDAYAQSKLALTMWSQEFANHESNPISIAVNPGSMLGTKMVKQAFGSEGKDIGIGSEILCRLSLSEEFENASGKYFDNDAGELSDPHPDTEDPAKVAEVLATIAALTATAG